MAEVIAETNQQPKKKKGPTSGQIAHFKEMRRRACRSEFQTLRRAIETSGIRPDTRELVTSLLPVLCAVVEARDIDTHDDRPEGMEPDGMAREAALVDAMDKLSAVLGG